MLERLPQELLHMGMTPPHKTCVMHSGQQIPQKQLVLPCKHTEVFLRRSKGTW
jgi:hypothetical protein